MFVEESNLKTYTFASYINVFMLYFCTFTLNVGSSCPEHREGSSSSWAGWGAVAHGLGLRQQLPTWTCCWLGSNASKAEALEKSSVSPLVLLCFTCRWVWWGTSEKWSDWKYLHGQLGELGASLQKRWAAGGREWAITLPHWERRFEHDLEPRRGKTL